MHMLSLTAVYVVFTALALILYTWLGYPILLKVLLTFRKKTTSGKGSEQRGGAFPSVTVILPVYNASSRIEAKLRNTLLLDYPADKLDVIVVSDGSCDDTEDKMRALTSDFVRLVVLNRNQGKSSAQNRAVREARGELVLFTDVDSELDREYLQRIVPAFADTQVAGAGGMAVLRVDGGHVSRSLGAYLRLEHFLRCAESELGMLHTLPGWGFVVRKSEFVPLASDTGDDMIIPLDLAVRKKRCVLVPEAVVADAMPSSIRGEFRARRRITLRNLTGIMRRRMLLNPFAFPRMAFALWSHKILRWLTPVFLILLLLSTALWEISAGDPLAAVLLAGQLVFYAAGGLGILLALKDIRVPVIGFLASFLLFNIGFLSGLISYLKGERVFSYTNHGDTV
ncbi:MAG: glycosyltransferase [Nitrospirota bacterium]|nr:glycosyltransferase [Nitrospirota bacterium]